MTTIAEIKLSYSPSKVSQKRINNSKDAYEILLPFFPIGTLHLQEHFIVAYLNNANHVIGVLNHTSGSMTATMTDSRLIYATALQCAATGIIVCHNHPSQSNIPSMPDNWSTLKLKEMGSIMDIKLLDHIIIANAEGEYYSYSDNGFDQLEKLKDNG